MSSSLDGSFVVGDTFQIHGDADPVGGLRAPEAEHLEGRGHDGEDFLMHLAVLGGMVVDTSELDVQRVSINRSKMTPSCTQNIYLQRL